MTIKEYEDSCNQKNLSYSKLTEEKEQIFSQFSAMVPQDHMFHVRMKRILKVNVTLEDDEDEEDSESDTDSEEDDSAGADIFEEEEDDSCPDGFDPRVLEQIIILRGKRCKVERQIRRVRRQIKNLEKENGRFKNRFKQISKEIDLAKEQLTAFQLDAQRRLNTIKVYRAIDTSNVYAWTNSEDGKRIMDTMSKAGVTTLMAKEVVNGLFQRIGTLKDEIRLGQESFKDLQKEINALKSSNQAKSTNTNELEQKCLELQLLKFGQPVNLEELDKLSAKNQTTEKKFSQQDNIVRKRYENELKNLKDEQDIIREKLVNATSENTKLLKEIASLKEQDLHWQENNKASNHELSDERSLKNYLQWQEDVIEMQTRYDTRAKWLDELKLERDALKKQNGKTRRLR